jgi:hypothetical protein
MRSGILLSVALATSSFLFSPLLGAQEREAETLVYEVRWGLAKVAALRLKSGCSNPRYRPVQLRAKSLGLAEQIHAFDIQLDSFIDLNTQSLQGRTSIEEEGHRRAFRTTFRGPKSTVTKDLGGDALTRTVDLPRSAHDLLSWIFQLRARELSAQSTHSFKVWDGWKLVEITAQIGRPEKKWIQEKSVTTIPAHLTRTRMSLSKPTSKQEQAKAEDLGTIWFADDRGHRPVAMSFLAPLRNAEIKLQRTLINACPSQE